MKLLQACVHKVFGICTPEETKRPGVFSYRFLNFSGSWYKQEGRPFSLGAGREPSEALKAHLALADTPLPEKFKPRRLLVIKTGRVQRILSGEIRRRYIPRFETETSDEKYGAVMRRSELVITWWHWRIWFELDAYREFWPPVYQIEGREFAGEPGSFKGKETLFVWCGRWQLLLLTHVE